MKTILCIEVSSDPGFRSFTVSLENNDPAVKFCEKARKLSVPAWIDHANDKMKLLKMWQRLDGIANVSAMPITFDYILYSWFD